MLLFDVHLVMNNTSFHFVLQNYKKNREMQILYIRKINKYYFFEHLTAN